MLLSALFYLFIVVGCIHLLHFALYLIGGNVYDTRSSLDTRRRAKIRRQRYRDPLISVLIPAYNEEAVIERCLESIRANSYKKIEVIVNNDASKDNTAAIVRQYIKQYPNFQLKLVSRRRNRGKASGLNYIAKHHANGELIMTLDADSLLHKDALKNVIKYFDNPQVAGVAANVRIIEEWTVFGLLQRFEHMIAYRSKKFYSLTNSELIIGGVGSTYRRSVMKKVRYYDTDTVTEDIGLSVKIAAEGNIENRLVYGADVAAMTEGVTTFKMLLLQRYRWKLGCLQNMFKYRQITFGDKRYSKMLSWYRMPMAFLGEFLLLLEPIAMAYVIYVSVINLTAMLFVSAYMTITVYILMSIWPDEHLSTTGKIRSSIYAPTLYFIFYIMNVVQLISIIRCLINTDQIIKLKKRENTWVSPRRVGKAASFS